MDYQKMLFAFHVRELAVARLVSQTPRDLSPEDGATYRSERLEQTVYAVVREINDFATMVGNAGV